MCCVPVHFMFIAQILILPAPIIPSWLQREPLVSTIPVPLIFFSHSLPLSFCLFSITLSSDSPFIIAHWLGYRMIELCSFKTTKETIKAKTKYYLVEFQKANRSWIKRDPSFLQLVLYNLLVCRNCVFISTKPKLKNPKNLINLKCKTSIACWTFIYACDVGKMLSATFKWNLHCISC